MHAAADTTANCKIWLESVVIRVKARIPYFYVEFNNKTKLDKVQSSDEIHASI